MKPKQYLIIAILLYTTSFIGCKKNWLDEKTDKNLVTPSTLKDLQALLDNASSIMNAGSPGLGEVATDGHYITDATWASSITAYEKNAYSWTHDRPYLNLSDWSKAYERIFYSNIVIEGLYKLNPNNIADQLTWNSIMGQALFHRAKNFYELAQIWAPPYQSTTADADLSIPLRLESDINIRTTRSTVKQSYTQIINDLLQAKNLLPITPLYKTRGSKPAAFALLARVYLSMEDYEKANQYSDSCLQINSTLLNYATEVTVTNSFPLVVFNKEVIFHSRMFFETPNNSALIDNSLYSLYAVNDLRRSAFFKQNSNGSISFKGSPGGSSAPFTGIDLDEVYLIRAECYARAGNITEAMADLNALLIKRWKAGFFTPFSATSSDDALSQILIERKKELLLRGFRWSDLRRLNRDLRFQTTLNRTIGSQNYTLSPNSFKYTFPIPDDIIQITGIQQNANW